MKARQIADYLKAQGFEPLSVAEADASTDGEIDFGQDVSVQVGCGYLLVCRFSEATEELSSWPMVRAPAELVAHLRAALAGEEPSY